MPTLRQRSNPPRHHQQTTNLPQPQRTFHPSSRDGYRHQQKETRMNTHPAETTTLSLFDDDVAGYSVRQIPNKEAHWFLLNIHYAKRIPSISFTYGLFHDGELVGVVCYGTPASSTLCKGICGEPWQKHVLELNRLVLLHNLPNEASRLVGASLKLLPKPRIIVSFADTAQNHEGVVYQATNFLYTGLSAKFKDPKVKGLEHQHHATYAHGLTNQQVIEKFGASNVYFVERSRKHRYVIFLGNKKEKRKMLADFRYKNQPYPKN